MENKNVVYSLFSAHNLKLLYKRKSDVMIVYLILVALIIVSTIINPKFLTARNILNLIAANTGLLLVTYAQLMIITLAGVDLSVGSIISVVNVVAVSIMNDHPVTWILGMLLCLGIGAGIGFINGLLVVKGKIQAIIATLATLTIFAGVALLVMDSPKGTFPKVLTKFIKRGWNKTFPIFLIIVVTIFMWLLMNRTNFGRNIMAIGGSEQAAESSGIKVGREKILVFTISGLLSAFGALYISLYASSGNPLIGQSYTQNSITTAVIAGTSLSGGKNSIIGCIAATLIMGIINNVLNLMHVYSYYQYVIQGLILIGALAVSAIRSNRQ